MIHSCRSSSKGSSFTFVNYFFLSVNENLLPPRSRIGLINYDRLEEDWGFPSPEGLFRQGRFFEASSIQIDPQLVYLDPILTDNLKSETTQNAVSAMSFELFEYLQNKDKNDNSPDMMEKMMETRSILLSGQVNKDLAEKVVKQLLLLESMNDDPIRVFIDSPGGDVDAGYAIFDMIRFVKPQVYTIGMGLVASAGALILLAAPKERRIGLPNSHYLIHQPLSGMRGVATEIEIHAKEMEKTRKKINELIAEETGQTLEKVELDTDRDYWMAAPAAVDYGLITRVITRRDELENG